MGVRDQNFISIPEVIPHKRSDHQFHRNDRLVHRTNHYIAYLILFILFPFFAFTQQEHLIAVQPTVMVIPFVKEGEGLRNIYEHQHAGPIRVSISRVKDGLDQSGIQTIDFRAILKQATSQEAMTIEQQTSIKQRVIELSAADIYIETETQVILTPKGNSVTVILSAYDAYTGMSLVNKLGHSPKFYTDNYEKLTEKALDTFLEDFTDALQESFQDMIQNGRSIAVDIGIAEDSQIDMDSEIGEANDLLSDVLENWFENNAMQAHFHVQGITATKMIIDEVKIPAIDIKTKKLYRPSKFAARLRKFLIQHNLQVTRDIQGSKIFITISG